MVARRAATAASNPIAQLAVRQSVPAQRAAITWRALVARRAAALRISTCFQLCKLHKPRLLLLALLLQVIQLLLEVLYVSRNVSLLGAGIR
eukprot:2858919-Pleurochrysis_carterae.AAC.1